jgi:hypothetical protein
LLVDRRYLWKFSLRNFVVRHTNAEGTNQRLCRISGLYVAIYTVIEPPKKPFCRREKRRSAANFVANASYWKTDRRLNGCGPIVAVVKRSSTSLSRRKAWV